MPTPQPDQRNDARKALDEQLANEPRLSAPSIPSDRKPVPLEALLPPKVRRPVAIAGVVENGVVRPLDSSVLLRENSRVVIVATDG